MLDCAVLVISGADGVQGHTETLWKLLTRYGIPVFLFVNKMDQEGTDCGKLLAELKSRFSEGCIDFGRVETGAEEVIEEIAVCDEQTMEEYLEKGSVAAARSAGWSQKERFFHAILVRRYICRVWKN